MWRSCCSGAGLVGSALDVSWVERVLCQARGCRRLAAPEVVLLRLDASQQGGLELRVCVEHRGKLVDLGAAIQQVRRAEFGLDQDDEL